MRKRCFLAKAYLNAFIVRAGWRSMAAYLVPVRVVIDCFSSGRKYCSDIRGVVVGACAPAV